MPFCFYPRLEQSCPNVSHCPHLGGAAIGTVVRLANETQESREYLHRTIDAERQTISQLLEENERLQKELDQVKRELKLERQNKFATNEQKRADKADAAEPESARPQSKKKRGAPVGHPGWYRKTPTEYDWAVDVLPPMRCPYCQGHVMADDKFDPSEHLQEDVIDDIAKKLASSDGAVHADETYSILNGKRAYFWVHGTTRYIHFTFGTTRSGQVSRNVLGDHFTGTLVTDCYSGYIAHVAGAKQKCLVHLARTARDWQKLTDARSADFAFFDAVKEFVKRGCEFHRLRSKGTLDVTQFAAEKTWLREELVRLETWVVTHGKAQTLQTRIVNYHGEWLVFVDDAQVPPTNNLAEQALRPLVVLRKITFGHRSLKGGERMAALMSVAETARRHGHRASQIFLALMSDRPSNVLRQLYAVA